MQSRGEEIIEVVKKLVKEEAAAANSKADGGRANNKSSR